MQEKKIFKIGTYRVELIVPDKTKDLRYSLLNNINVYDDKDRLLWNISKLLKTYSDNNGLRYYDEMYFEIRLLDNQNIFCVGFTNHCEINLQTGRIIRLVNNR